MSGRRELGRLCVLGGLWIVSACGGRVATGVGGESHFACAVDGDCAQYGADLACIQNRCQSTEAAQSAGGAGAPAASSDVPMVEAALREGELSLQLDSRTLGAGGRAVSAGGRSTPSPTSEGSGLPCDEGASCPPSQWFFGGAIPDGRLIIVYWTGSREAVALLDPRSESTALVGYLDGLATWQGQIAYDRPRNIVYAAGQDWDDRPYLYGLSLDTGSSTTPTSLHDTLPCPAGSQCNPQALVFGGVTDDGSIVVAHWTGSTATVRLLDPATGNSTLAGTVGNGNGDGWSGLLVYDDARRVAYGVGRNAAGATLIHELSLDTGDTASIALGTGAPGDLPPPTRSPEGYVFGGVTAGGRLIAAYWTGSAEAAILIDPATGDTSLAGYIDGLYTWQGQLFRDRARDILYAAGKDEADLWHLYSLPIVDHGP